MCRKRQQRKQARQRLSLIHISQVQRADEGLSLWPDAGVHLTTLMELTAYAAPDAASAAIPLPAGTALDPLGSDNDGGMDYRVNLRRWACLLAALACLLALLPLPAHAAGAASKVVRVGWYEDARCV